MSLTPGSSGLNASVNTTESIMLFTGKSCDSSPPSRPRAITPSWNLADNGDKTWRTFKFGHDLLQFIAANSVERLCSVNKSGVQILILFEYLDILLKLTDCQHHDSLVDDQCGWAVFSRGSFHQCTGDILISDHYSTAYFHYACICVQLMLWWIRAVVYLCSRRMKTVHVASFLVWVHQICKFQKEWHLNLESGGFFHFRDGV